MLALSADINRVFRNRGVRLLAANMLLAVFATAWFAVHLVVEWGPAWIGWAPSVVSLALCALTIARTARMPELHPAARRFWRGVAVAAWICGLASLLDAVGALAAPRAPGEPEQLSAPVLILYMASLLVAMWALLRIPIGRRSWSDWLALGLDAAIVLLGASLFLWEFAISPLMEARREGASAWMSVLASALSLVLLFAVLKVVLGGVGPVSARALRLIALGLLIGGLGSGVEPLSVSRPAIVPSQFFTPWVAAFTTWAAVRQRGDALVSPAPRRAGRRRAPSFSLLPYAALAAVQALLIAVTLRFGDEQTMLVVAAAVAVTGLVAVRQVVASLDRERLLRRLGEHEQRFRMLVQNASDITTIQGMDGRIVYVSPAVERVLGHSPEAWAQRLASVGYDDVHPDDRPRMAHTYAELHREPGRSLRVALRMRHADGSWRWLDTTITNLVDVPGVEGIVSNASDVTGHQELQGRLRHQALHDGLTRLANRSLFSERVDGAIAALEDSGDGGRIAVLLVDLDDFKTVNDTLGHANGDALLVAVARRLRDGLGADDTVARLGGDEFAVLLPEGGAEAGVRAAERILASLAQPIEAQGHMLLVRASIGITEGGPGDDAGGLLRNADIAMYAAKERGKGAYAVYAPDMDARILQHVELGVQLRQAISTGELRLHYQPIVGLPTGRAASVEALVRWQHPVRGMIPPGAFVPVAETTGLIVPLGRWVLREACRQLVAWHTALGAAAPRSVSVNVAVRQLQEPGFLDEVKAALADAGMEPGGLMIEVTESAALTGGEVLATLQDLHALGVRLALDDFGTGQSSLSLLRTCPVDVLKLDKSFVDELGRDGGREAVAKAVILTARALGLDAIAEGIETSEQAEQLARLGYQLGQGYLFARPLPPDELGVLLAAPPQTLTGAHQ